MSKEEFLKLLQDAEISYGAVSVAESCYHLSMMTSTDEISTNRHMYMTFVEFLEAFARVVDRPTKTRTKTLLGGWNLRPFTKLPGELPLFRKIEIQIIKLLNLL